MEEATELNGGLPRQTLIPVMSDSDIVLARKTSRDMAEWIGFVNPELTVIATAVSEIARNIIEYAKRGEVFVQNIQEGQKNGILIIARDRGPGIPDIPRAMQDGFSTSNSLGLGLPGAKRLMDEFDIVAPAGQGTTVTMKKWNI